MLIHVQSYVCPLRRALTGFVSVAALTLLAAQPALGRAATLTVGANVDTSTKVGNEAEGAIAIDPTNPLRMFTISNTESGAFLYGGYSTNGGATWTKRNIATGGDGLAAACCDASCAWDSFGNLFLCYLSSPGGVVVGRSIDGGVSFTTVINVGGGFDQPTVTVGANSMWFCYNSGGTMRARGASVSGLGVIGAVSSEFTMPSGSGSFGDICIGPGGQIMLTYCTNTGGQGPENIFCNIDPDGLGGAPFGPKITITSTNVGSFDFIPAQSTRSVDSEAGLAWDRTGGPHNGRVYLVYTDEVGNESNNMDTELRYSDNNGTTWSAPLRVNDDATTRSQFLPRISIDQTTGVVAIIWYDCRNDIGTVGGGFTDTIANNEAQIYGTVSTDGGVTVQPNILISAGVSKASSAASGIDLGDYIGLAFQSGKFFPLWADNSAAPLGNPNLPKLDQVTAGVTVTLPNPCPADIAPTGGNGQVNIDDLLAVINHWGVCVSPPIGCLGDIAPAGGNGQVNIDDLLLVINAWGPCP